MNAHRTLSTVMELDNHEAGERFSARGARFAVDLDPFLNIDLFRMTGPVFAPHPHAGFSAVTYMFDDSTTRFHNRDSLGDRSMIEPGGLHWTVAGSGIVHDEVVEETGRLGHGAQIFVRLPQADETADPYGMHFTPAELPSGELAEGVWLRVVAGEAFGMHSGVREAARAHVYDLDLRPGARVEIPVDPGFRGFVMTVEGTGRVATPTSRGALGPAGLAVFEQGQGAIELEAGERGARLLFGAGRPLLTPAYMYGGFCLSSREQVTEAVDRYRSGAMHGLLVPP
ncbi:redox-sensitive bicupin YhaK (pirin superfamily) [Streptomyces sp. SAI-133]|uniref:pirin family protein n=1 Tax=unclassified Streptomyces TaxID=2593676 RepID=UPI002476C877|nr:pirin-like C-terminal cupin domain-containing protein [Streptomyces sp. SAI-133]MDH6590034.1 redox-sensitive bicupin YhaK (pirin superfamily) [Streptomyces sp. SAI-133]